MLLISVLVLRSLFCLYSAPLTALKSSRQHIKQLLRSSDALLTHCVSSMQANILSHPDDTLEFLQRLSPERSPVQPAQRHSFAEVLTKALTRSPLQPLKQQQQPQPEQQQEQQLPAPATPPQQQVLARRTSLCPPAGLARLQLPQHSPDCQAAAPPPAASFAERKQAMTRVSATVDELLGAIVGELV